MTQNMTYTDLAGKTALVAGGTHGLGRAVVKKLVSYGCNVFICSRTASDVSSIIQEVTETQENASISGAMCDISQPSEVSMLFSSLLAKFGRLDIVVNCAGVYGPMGDSELVKWDDWTKAIEINLFGAVLLATEAVKLFKPNNSGKIIQMSGGGATRPLPWLSAYAASKAAVVRYMETLAIEVQKHKIDVNTVAPGALNTRMLTEVLEAGPELVGADYFEQNVRQEKSGGASIDNAVDLICFLSSNRSDGITARLISAVWDNWNKFEGRQEEIVGSEVMTLRRLNGAAAGVNWIDR